jgi:hypothetical protein
MQSLNEHIKTECRVEWVEHTLANQDSSLGIAAHYRQIDRGYNFELNRIKKSFALIYNEYVVLFKRDELKWSVRAVGHKGESKRVEITFWLPKESEKFESYTTIQIHPENSLDAEDGPEIPLEAVEMQVEQTQEDDFDVPSFE